MKQQTLQILRALFTGLFIFLLAFGLPLAWILRDGLGPDSVTSSGLQAVWRCLTTFHVGPVLLLCAIAIGTIAILQKKSESPAREESFSP
jgi:hypothetical protein